MNHPQALSLFTLTTLLLAACSSAPTTSDQGVLTEASSEAEGPLIQTKSSEVELPELPEGCAYNLDDPGTYLLVCGASVGIMSRTEFPQVTDPMFDSSISGVIAALEDSGWEMAVGEGFEITTEDGIMDLIHIQGARAEERLDAFSGFVEAGQESFRFFTCILPRELLENWADECFGRSRVLLELAAATPITGLLVRGQDVAIPAGCRAMENGIHCGQNSITWTEYSGHVPTSEFEETERALLQTFPNYSRLDVRCEFGGEEMECSAIRLELEGHAPQLAIFAYAQIGDSTLRLICEAPLHASEVESLPACELLMKVEIAQ